MNKLIRIVFHNHQGEGLMTCLGLGTFLCLGKAGVNYPEDLTIYPNNLGVKQHPYFSQTYTCPPNNNSIGQCRIDYAILIWGQEGIYIHGWPNPPTYTGNGNQGTHGCIHLSMGDARIVYNWVDSKTRILIHRPW